MAIRGLSKILCITLIVILLFPNLYGYTVKPLRTSHHINTDYSAHTITHLLDGIFFRFLLFGWRVRSYRIHIPPSYTGEFPIPLVLILHGGGGRSFSIAEKTEFTKKADEEGFIAVYPNGISRLITPLSRHWNSGHAGGIALQREIDDVGFFRELITKIQSFYNINASRIYITGLSNGGMMTYRLGAELSDIIAAVAPVAGTIGGQATENSPLWVIPEPDYPVSVFTVHGKLDKNVPYDGGHGSQTSGTRIDLSVNESIAFWVEQNECDPVPETNVSGNISIDTYKNGLAGTEVVLVTILNGEHWWPGSDKDPYQEISATDFIWDFFQKHPKQ